MRAARGSCWSTWTPKRCSAPSAPGTRFACTPQPTCAMRPRSTTAVQAALARFGRIDALCHLAGGFRMGEAVHETSDGDWDFLFDLNARSFVHVARAVVPRMLAQGGGRIVSVGAAAALKGVGQMGAYCASKAALIRLTEAMSAELREHGINVNCVLPSVIDTPENRAAMPDADPARWVAPAALADAIVFWPPTRRAPSTARRCRCSG